jgi:hypothetical protein
MNFICRWTFFIIVLGGLTFSLPALAKGGGSGEHSSGAVQGSTFQNSSVKSRSLNESPSKPARRSTAGSTKAKGDCLLKPDTICGESSGIKARNR